jgi:hypothetical protein
MSPDDLLFTQSFFWLFMQHDVVLSLVGIATFASAIISLSIVIRKWGAY